MNIDILDLEGEPQARGERWGLSRRGRIQACNSAWLGSLRAAGILDPHAYIADLLSNTNFLDAIRQHTPDLLEEVRGIAKGAEQPFDVMLAAQLMDEEWAYRPRYIPNAPMVEKCSSVAIASEGGLTWIGQNMDLGGYTDGHQLLLRIAPSAREQGALIFTIGGMIGLLGVNSSGVGVCVNSLPQLPAAGGGLPVAFMIRKVLQARSVEDAARSLLAIPHATGQHYLLADCREIRSFEASSSAVSEYHSPNPRRVLHTNHPLATDAGEEGSARDQANTVTRLRSLTHRLMNGNPDLDAIKAALSSFDDPDHPVCRLPSADGPVSSVTGMISFTTGSMVSELRKDSAEVSSWVSAGPPSIRSYTRVDLR